MKRPSVEDIDAAIAKTWPAESVSIVGGVTLRNGNGGQRATAATVDGHLTLESLSSAEMHMKPRGESLFRVKHGQRDLDRRLSDQGYGLRDRTNLLVCSTSQILEINRPPVSAFKVWPPLAIMNEIWRDHDIDEHRQGIMHRAASPKVAVLGRANAMPGGVAFAASHNDLAMIHAVAVREDLRRQKIAQSMMVAIAEWANGINVPWLTTLCTEDNVIATNLYTSLGFEIVGQYHYRAKKFE